MKKSFLLISALVVLSFFVCGNSLAQNAYKFSEQKDSVVKIIWNTLKTEDDCISRIVAELEKIDKNRCVEAEHFHSKTSMDFNFSIPYSNYLIGDSLWAKFQLQCYQKTNGSWIAVINQDVFNVYVDLLVDLCEGLTVVQYTGKKMSYPKLSAVFPKDCDFDQLDNLFPKCTFSDTEMHYYSHELGPLHFVWNGKSFESSSKIIYNCITDGCTYECMIMLPPFSIDNFVSPNYYLRIGGKWEGSPDGIIYDGKQTVAKFDIKDGIIEGYTILHPSYGVAMEYTEDNYVASAPATIGTPIQYVLNHLNKVPNTKTFANGKYVVTLQNGHDTKHLKRDIFLEFTSKDENSPIETIRVYSIPLTVTLMSEVESENLTNDAKTIFKALNFNEKKYGEFKRMYINYNDEDEAANGFEMEFATEDFKKSDDWLASDYDLKVQFQIYKAKNKYLVALSKIKSVIDNLGVKFWYYENGQFTPAEITLPTPGIKDAHYRFNDKGIVYYYDNNIDYQWVFSWNGETFVKD